MTYNEDSSVSGHDEPWIQWFCGLKGHEMFCEVERAYIEDGFNLYGLRACVPNFSDCLDLMLDRIGPDDSDDSHLTQSACTLYGLIHARYIITAHGLDAMYNKYASKEFGTCPLLQCGGQPVLPVGVKDEVGVDTVKVFCPKCQNVYHPPPIRSRGGSCTVDGASFGTTFPHLFLMTFSNLVPDRLTSDSVYVPRVFGFRVHQSARQRNGTTTSLPTSSSATTSMSFRGNTRLGTETDLHSKQADSSLPIEDTDPLVEVSTRNDQNFLPDPGEAEKGEDQDNLHEKGRIQENKTLSIGDCPEKSELKSNSIGGTPMEGKTGVGNMNSSSTKRKSKISAASCAKTIGQSESIGKGIMDNGDNALKNKSKRQRRPGVT